MIRYRYRYIFYGLRFALYAFRSSRSGSLSEMSMDVLDMESGLDLSNELRAGIGSDMDLRSSSFFVIHSSPFANENYFGSSSNTLPRPKYAF